MAWTTLTDPSSGGSLNSLLCEGGAIYVGGVAQLWKSIDSGGSWSEIGAGGLPAGHQIACIGIAPNGTIFVGTNKVGTEFPAVYYWTGSAWTQPSGLPTNLTLKFSAFRKAYGYFYVSTAFNGEVFQSTNNGLNWTLYANNATIRDPTDPSTRAIWNLNIISDGRLCASGEFVPGGIFRDPRHVGGQWVNVGPTDADNYSANVKHLFSWTGEDGAVYVGRRHNGDGKYISKANQDNTWVTTSTGLTAFQVVTALGKDAAGVLWEAQQPTSGDGHTYRSVDSGANWALYESGLPAHQWIQDRGLGFDSSYVYILGVTVGIYRAPAGG